MGLEVVRATRMDMDGGLSPGPDMIPGMPQQPGADTLTFQVVLYIEPVQLDFCRAADAVIPDAADDTVMLVNHEPEQIALTT